jgi:methyl-accepting chemotaxis protein
MKFISFKNLFSREGEDIPKGMVKNLEEVKTAIDALKASMDMLSKTQANVKIEVDKSAEALKGVDKASEKTRAGARKQAEDLEKSITAYTDLNNVLQEQGETVNDLERQYKQAKKAFKDSPIDGKKSKESAEKARKLNEQIKSLNSSLKTNKRANEAVAGSYDAMQKKLTDARKRLKQLPNAFSKNNKEAQKLKKEVHGLTQQMKDFDNEINQNFRNVGNYGSALSGLKERFHTVSRGASKVTEGMRAMAGFGIGGAILGGISDTIASLTEMSKMYAKLTTDVQRYTNTTREQAQGYAANISGSKTFGKETDEVLTATNQLSKQMGISFDDALGLVEKGFLNGADATGDFLAKLAEYPVQFKKAGMMSPAVEAAIKPLGEAFNKDLIKRIKNGSLSTTKAFLEITKRAKEAGLNVQEMQTLTADLGGGAVEDLGGIEVAYDLLTKAQNTNLDVLDLAGERQKETLELQKELEATNVRLSDSVASFGKASENAWIKIKTGAMNALVAVLDFFNIQKQMQIQAEENIKMLTGIDATTDNLTEISKEYINMKDAIKNLTEERKKYKDTLKNGNFVEKTIAEKGIAATEAQIEAQQRLIAKVDKGRALQKENNELAAKFAPIKTKDINITGEQTKANGKKIISLKELIKANNELKALQDIGAKEGLKQAAEVLRCLTQKQRHH